MKKTLSKLIVALLRVSTDEQDTQRQRLAIERYAKQNGLVIARWYEDKESRDLSESRPEFQKLIAAVQSGQVLVVLIEKFDRFGVSGKEEWFYYRYIFQRKQAKIISVHPSEGDLTAKDDRTMLTTFFGADASEREQKSISTRVLSGKSRLAEQGDWLGGPAPLGYDKVCLDHAGNILWRLVRTGKNSYLQIHTGGHTVNLTSSPGRGKNERLKLDINPEQAEVVCRIFLLWTTERISLMGIATLLNREGIRLHGKPFNGTTIKFILSNKRYLGMSVWNEKLGGRFHEYKNGQIAEIPQEARDALYASGKKTKRILRRNAEEQWIVCPGAHPAIIDPDVFDLAQKKLAEVKDNKNRAPRTELLWLKDLLWCGSCMKPLKGSVHKGKAWYYCRTYDNADHQGLAASCGCGRNTISHEQAERLVNDWLGDKGLQLSVVNKQDLASLFRAIADHEEQTEICLKEDGWRSYLRKMAEYADDDLKSIINATLSKKKLTMKDMRPVEEAKPKSLSASLESLNAEYQAVLRSKGKANSDREEAFWKTEQSRLESAMATVESLAVPLVKRLDDAIERAVKMLERLEQAREEIKGGTPRQKAEALRRLLDKVVLHFSRKRSRGSRFYYTLERADFISPFTQSASRTR